MRILPLCLAAAICLSSSLALANDKQAGVEAFENRDYATAYKLLSPLESEGDPEVLYMMGRMYWDGKVVEQDDDRAFQLQSKSAEKGFAKGQAALGFHYLFGYGTEENGTKALKWYKASAAQGEPKAYYVLGYMHSEGEGVEQDKEEALRWYKLAVEQGHVASNFEIGKILEQGQGTAKDLKNALAYYKKAAALGHEEAPKKVAELLLRDILVDSDIAEMNKLKNTVAEKCDRDPKCIFDQMWQYLDVSGDNKISLAEVARIQRALVKRAYVENSGEEFDAGELVAVNTASILLLPITASSVINSFDYDSDGLLSKNEVVGNTEFAKLVGVDASTLSGLEFDKLGKKLLQNMNKIPFL